MVVLPETPGETVRTDEEMTAQSLGFTFTSLDVQREYRMLSAFTWWMKEQNKFKVGRALDAKWAGTSRKFSYLQLEKTDPLHVQFDQEEAVVGKENLLDVLAHLKCEENLLIFSRTIRFTPYLPQRGLLDSPLDYPGELRVGVVVEANGDDGRGDAL